MKFEQALVEGKLIRRYNRFLADVRLSSGEEITAHCANPGSMKGVSEPGSKVLLSVNSSPRRKFNHQLEIVYSGRTPVGIHTSRPISVVSEALENGQIPELAGYAMLRRQTRVRGQQRIDLVLEGNSLRPCYVLVENVTSATNDTCYFPDIRYPTGITTSEHLTNLIREGNRAMVIFVAQRNDVRVRHNYTEDRNRQWTRHDIGARGVEVLAYSSKVTRRGIELDKRLAMEFGN